MAEEEIMLVSICNILAWYISFSYLTITNIPTFIFVDSVFWFLFYSVGSSLSFFTTWSFHLVLFYLIFVLFFYSILPSILPFTLFYFASISCICSSGGITARRIYLFLLFIFSVLEISCNQITKSLSILLTDLFFENLNACSAVLQLFVFLFYAFLCHFITRIAVFFFLYESSLQFCLRSILH